MTYYYPTMSLIGGYEGGLFMVLEITLVKSKVTNCIKQAKWLARIMWHSLSQVI